MPKLTKRDLAAVANERNGRAHASAYKRLFIWIAVVFVVGVAIGKATGNDWYTIGILVVSAMPVVWYYLRKVVPREQALFKQLLEEWKDQIEGD